MNLDIRESHDTTKFPDSVLQGLHKLEEVLKLPSTPHLHKLQQQIIEENIFNSQEVPSGSKLIGPIEELILVRSVAQYLAQVIDPASRNTLFITLFPVVSNEPQNSLKSRVLIALVSLAVATHNIAVLDATAVWMQQVSCFSVRCCRVCYGLIQDIFQNSGETLTHFMKALKALPTATPLFTANLITSLAQVYAKIGTKDLCDEPPEYLLKIIVHWLRTHSLLTLTPLTTSLPGISLPMIAVLPIAPLAKWCIEAPFFSDDKKNKEPTSQELYSELHLLLLQTLQGVSSVRSQMTQREVICAEHLKNIAESLQIRLIDEKRNISEASKDAALNRFAQIVLVALQTECLSGRIVEMWNTLKKLPNKPRIMTTLFSFSPVP